MEIIEYLEQFNEYLERSFVFRSFRFGLGFYLIVMVTVMAIALYRLVKDGYMTVLQTGTETPSVKGRMQARWDESVGRLQTDNSNEWKAAILEVSSMLNEILGVVGYEGELLGEKLENILPSQLDNLEQIKQANKVKNRIVNDDSFMISKEEAQRTVETFGQALEFLEAIQI